MVITSESESLHGLFLFFLAVSSGNWCPSITLQNSSVQKNISVILSVIGIRFYYVYIVNSQIFKYTQKTLFLYKYFLFLISVSVKVYYLNKNRDTKEYAFAWIICALIFTISGIAYPSFIQDRTTDIFWWIGALLITNTIVTKEKD